MPERETSPNISSITIFRKGEKAPHLSNEKISRLIVGYFLTTAIDPETGERKSHWIRILEQIYQARENLAQLTLEKEGGAMRHGPGETSVEEIRVKNSRLARGELYFRIRGGSQVIPETSARPEDVTLNPNEVMVKVQLDTERLNLWLQRLGQQKSIR